MLKQLAPILLSRDLSAAETSSQRLFFGTKCLNGVDCLLVKREGAEAHRCLKSRTDPRKNNASPCVGPSDIRTVNTDWGALETPREEVRRVVLLEDKRCGLPELATIDPDRDVVRAGWELPFG